MINNPKPIDVLAGNYYLLVDETGRQLSFVFSDVDSKGNFSCVLLALMKNSFKVKFLSEDRVQNNRRRNVDQVIMKIEFDQVEKIIEAFPGLVADFCFYVKQKNNKYGTA